MQSSKKESNSARILRRSPRVLNDLEAIQPRRTRGQRCRYVFENSIADSSVDSSEDDVEDDVTNIEPAPRTTDSSERSSSDPARQLHSSESSLLEVDPCEPSQIISVAEPEQLLMPENNMKTEPGSDASPIVKVSEHIKPYKKRRRNELDILFTTRGSSDAEINLPSSYQVGAEIHDRAKRIKQVEDSRSSPLIEGIKTSNRADKQKTLECQPGNEQARPAVLSRKHGPSRWRQRADNPLFRTPDPEKNPKGSGLRESALASAESPRRKAQCLPGQRSDQMHTPPASVITRAQYKDLITRSSLEPFNGDRGLFDSSPSRTSSLGSRRRQNSYNRTRPKRDFSDKEVSGCTSLDYPPSWDKADAADRRLVEMRDRKVVWNVVRDTWQDITERLIAPENLKIRHSYLVSLRDSQSNVPGFGADVEDGADVRSENAGKRQQRQRTSKVSRADHNERMGSSEGDEDSLEGDLEQPSESEESKDSDVRYREDSKSGGPAKASRDRSPHNLSQRALPSASTTVNHVPASPRNDSSLSWKLASRQEKSQNPLEKYYKHLKTVFQGRDLVTEHAEPGTAVKALELAASIIQNVSINADAPDSAEDRPIPCNDIQTIREEPLEKHDATLLLAVEAEVDSRLMTQKHIAIAEMMRSKGLGLFRPAFIEQELNRLKNEGKKEQSCCVITKSETHQSLTTAFRLEKEKLNITHRDEVQTLENAHRAQITHLVTSHRAQITKILDKIRHEAQEITGESTKTNLDSMTRDTPPSSSSSVPEASDPFRRPMACDNCHLAHTKCTKEASETKCSRCVNLEIECIYGVCRSRTRTTGVKESRTRDSSEESEWDSGSDG